MNDPQRSKEDEAMFKEDKDGKVFEWRCYICLVASVCFWYYYFSPRIIVSRVFSGAGSILDHHMTSYIPPKPPSCGGRSRRLGVFLSYSLRIYRDVALRLLSSPRLMGFFRDFQALFSIPLCMRVVRAFFRLVLPAKETLTGSIIDEASCFGFD